jgi:hypothetical protein
LLCLKAAAWQRHAALMSWLTGLFVEFCVTTMTGSPTTRRMKLNVTEA